MLNFRSEVRLGPSNGAGGRSVAGRLPRALPNKWTATRMAVRDIVSVDFLVWVSVAFAVVVFRKFGILALGAYVNQCSLFSPSWTTVSHECCYPNYYLLVLDRVPRMVQLWPAASGSVCILPSKVCSIFCFYNYVQRLLSCTSDPEFIHKARCYLHTGSLGLHLSGTAWKVQNQTARFVKGLQGTASLTTDDLTLQTWGCRNNHSLAYQILRTRNDIYMSSFFPQAISGWNKFYPLKAPRTVWQLMIDPSE